MTRLYRRTLCAAIIGSFCYPALAAEDSDIADWVGQGETVRSITLPDQGPVTLDGWTRQGKGEVYRLDVKKGEIVNLDFSTSSEFGRLVIFDMDHPNDDSIYTSDEDGLSKVLNVMADTRWFIRPFLIRSASRRGLGIHYNLRLERQKM